MMRCSFQSMLFYTYHNLKNVPEKIQALFAFRYIYTAFRDISLRNIRKYDKMKLSNFIGNGGICMKTFFAKYSGMLAALALVITTMTVNSTCTFLIYQDELPQDAYKLRKF